MPVLMALLICVNILVWARNGINYVFIFSAPFLSCPICRLTIRTELNPRLRHDHQEYFEVRVVSPPRDVILRDPKASFFPPVHPCLRILVLHGSTWPSDAVAFTLAYSHLRGYV